MREAARCACRLHKPGATWEPRKLASFLNEPRRDAELPLRRLRDRGRRAYLKFSGYGRRVNNDVDLHIKGGYKLFRGESEILRRDAPRSPEKYSLACARVYATFYVAMQAAPHISNAPKLSIPTPATD